MKCYVLSGDFGCQTLSNITWALEQGGEMFHPDDTRDSKGRWWHPYDDVACEVGGNTWAASGPMTADTKDKLSRLWAQPRGGKKPFAKSHVLGDFGFTPAADVIVDTAFVETMTRLDPSLFDFTPHDKVWDPKRNCQPWDGPYYFATILPMLASYDLEAGGLVLREGIKEKYRGAYGSDGKREAVRASTISGRLLWRDTYTRRVMCTDEFLRVLKSLPVPEWEGREINVIPDGH